jgi:hypothetical protein
MFFSGFTVLLIGTSAVRSLRLPTSRIVGRGRHNNGGSFSVTRPGTSSHLSTTLVAATTGGDDNDLSSVRDIVYMATVTVAGKGACVGVIRFCRRLTFRVDYAVQIDTGSSDMWIRSDSMAQTQVSASNLFM